MFVYWMISIGLNYRYYNEYSTIFINLQRKNYHSQQNDSAIFTLNRARVRKTLSFASDSASPIAPRSAN